MSSFSVENGYTPSTFEELVDQFRLEINAEFGVSYNEETFIGSGWYKFAYSVWQRVALGEIRTSEVFLKLQEYITLTNQKIQRPSVSTPGLIESMKENGFLASLKPPSEGDAGKIFVCIDLDDGADDYEDKKLQAATLLKDYVVAGMVFEGSEEELITISNGQQFSFKFNLPNRIPVILRITLDVSENTTLLVPSDEDVRSQLMEQVLERYQLGKNFEPERYFTAEEAPWASSILLEWSDNDGEDWSADVYDAEYDDVFEFGLEDITVTINE